MAPQFQGVCLQPSTITEIMESMFNPIKFNHSQLIFDSNSQLGFKDPGSQAKRKERSGSLRQEKEAWCSAPTSGLGLPNTSDSHLTPFRRVPFGLSLIVWSLWNGYGSQYVLLLYIP